MSRRPFRNNVKTVLTNQDLKCLQLSENKPKSHFSKHLNSPTGSCKVCGGERSFDINTKRQEPFVGHHVSYYPPIIAFVHYDCHEKIHDLENPISKLIQYSEGDSRKYYDLKEESINSKYRFMK